MQRKKKIEKLWRRKFIFSKQFPDDLLFLLEVFFCLPSEIEILRIFSSFFGSIGVA